MPEAVIVDAVRTPIGRAVKGSLKDVRADDLASIPLKALKERNPDVDFGETGPYIAPAGLTIQRLFPLAPGRPGRQPAAELRGRSGPVAPRLPHRSWR